MQDQKLDPGVHVATFPGDSREKSLLVRGCSVVAALTVLFWLPVASPAVSAQTEKGPGAPASSLQEHYDSAQNFQAAGDLAHAAIQYKLFLAEALSTLGTNRASVGDFEKVGPLFEEALTLEPADIGVRLAYAEACRQGHDLPKAQSLAQTAVEAAPKSAKAHLALGRILLQMNKNQASAEQFEIAVAIEPDFANGYALADAYLHMKDEAHATRIFAEMLAGFGDSPEIHMKFGSAYAESGYPEQAIQEFKKVIAENSQYPGAHYSLGAAYLVGLGEAAYAEAVPEFRKEVEISPNDFYSQFQLGYIALGEHRFPEAETELSRAAALDPQNPDSFLSLGQLYSEMNRAVESEAALRKAISLTTDVSRNHYQVQRAHYLLARLLLQSGRQNEGKQEMQVSADLLQKSVLQNQGKSAGMSNNEEAGAIPWKDTKNSESVNPEVLKQVESFEAQAGPAIADSFDNLGAIAASENDFAGALPFFQQAYRWNPSLEGLDYNWGKAAYSANQYDQAAGPLGRYLQAHPDDTWARSAMGVSLFRLKNYSDALQALQPMDSLVDADPKLAFAYAVCLVKTGDFSRGVARLRELAADSPNDAATHEALGEALASQRDLTGAASEFRAALKLDPSGTDAKYNLALILIGLKENDKAQRLLTEMVAARSRNSDAYFQLGKLQLDRGEIKAAIATLQAGAKLDPGNGFIHLELAAAYRKEFRQADAERETKAYDALQKQQPGPHDSAKPD